MEINCPKCQVGTIVEKEKLFSCTEQSYNSETKQNEGCDFVLWKNQFGAELNMEDVEKLVNGETITKKCISKNTGKEYDGNLTLDETTYKIVLSFPERKEAEVDKNGISEFSKGYKKGDVIVWKTIAGATITYEEALKLFSGDVIRKENMKSQAGKEFSANLSLNEEGKIDMSFD
jgi:hypothetical protein